ncbi:hypothetical protein Emag_001738 [Eimeria magna]
MAAATQHSDFTFALLTKCSSSSGNSSHRGSSNDSTSRECGSNDSSLPRSRDLGNLSRGSSTSICSSAAPTDKKTSISRIRSNKNAAAPEAAVAVVVQVKQQQPQQLICPQQQKQQKEQQQERHRNKYGCCSAPSIGNSCRYNSSSDSSGRSNCLTLDIQETPGKSDASLRLQTAKKPGQRGDGSQADPRLLSSLVLLVLLLLRLFVLLLLL